MDPHIETSTPNIYYDKKIPPPPRRLWGEDSPTKQLYHNKWVKYRKATQEKEPSWSGLDAPCFVDFENIPDYGDSYFDHIDEEKFATPQKTLDKPLPGLEENNNILDFFRRCSLSAIKNPQNINKTDVNETPTQVNEAVKKLIPSFSESPKAASSSTIQNDVKETESKKSESLHFRSPNNRTEKPRLKKSLLEKNKKSENRHCTIIEPFSFETREKCNQEHKQARRERDSAGKEIWQGFRANPVPNFLKLSEKRRISVKPQVQKKKPNNTEMLKLCDAAEIWKKKSFQPSLPKKVTGVPKPPKLLTAIRAKERQRFENELREKERERQARKEMEEIARKKREEEEIAKLRKELVHKAQPIRKYKIIIPKVEKRPLAEPTTPLTNKRRRKV